MRILSVSDKVVHELYDRFDPELVQGVEAIFACGDLPPEYLTFLRNRVDAPLYYVLGNHDIRYGKTPPVGCTYIHRRIVRLGEYRVLGLSGSRWYNGGSNQYHEAEMARIIHRLWFKLRLGGGVDIILTHAPPRHIHDAEDRCHKGFKCFRRLLERYAPTWFIHGHIHAHFEGDHKRTTVINTTRVMNTYGFVLFEI
jgi:Icc-related predicted phosphoesterase